MNPVNYLGQKITDSSSEIALRDTLVLRHLQIVILYFKLLFHNNSPFLRVKGFWGETMVLTKNH